MSAASDSWLCCCAESLLVLSGVFFFFIFDTLLSEGGGESWNMTATLKLLSYVKEKGFLSRIPLLEEKTMSGNMEHCSDDEAHALRRLEPVSGPG